MSSPLRITPKQFYALAVFCILEGSGNLQDTGEQLKVAAVIVNRTNSPNWSGEFGKGIVDQLFARGQFEVITRFKLDSGDFVSIDKAAKALADAKGRSVEWGKELILAFGRAAASTEAYGKAVKAVAHSTGFRGKNGTNVFRVESPKYDAKELQSKQPSCIMVDWGKEKALF